MLKGPAAARLYPDPALRPFADLDLLLPRDRLEAGAAALAPRGFEPMVEFARGFAETLGHDLHLRRLVGRRSIDVELHWRVGDDELGRGLSHERLREGARAVRAWRAPSASRRRRSPSYWRSQCTC